MRFAKAVVIALALAGCSSAGDLAAADREVARFHQMLNSAQLNQIYEGASPDMHRTTTKERFVEFLDAVHRKLGRVRKAERQSFNVQVGTGGRMTTVQYRTDFEAGPAQETFVFRTSGADAKLAGYHINSDPLILN